MTRPQDAATEALADDQMVCEKCGRLFLTMPKDGRDHYRLLPWQAAYEPSAKCGGYIIRKARKSG